MTIDKKPRMSSKESAAIIKEYAEALQKSLPEYRITIVIRDPTQEVSVHSVLVVTNDDPKKVLEAVEKQAVMQPNFGSKQ